MKGEAKPKEGLANNVVLKNIDISCEAAFSVEKSDLYTLKDFTFENVKIKALKPEEENLKAIQNLKQTQVSVTKVASLSQYYDKKDDSDISVK